MADTMPNSLKAGIKSLLTTGKYSDFVLTCGSDTYKVHKAVVCTRSGVFMRAERFPVEQKAATAKFDLSEDNPTAVKLLVQYMYEEEYTPELPDGTTSMGVRTFLSLKQGLKINKEYHYKFPHTCKSECPSPDHNVCPHHECWPKSCGEQCLDFVCNQCCLTFGPVPSGDASQMLLHARLYELGDKYDVVGLKDLAREKFYRACAVYWDSEHFAAAAYHAFSTTPENDKGLRDIVISTILSHMALLNKPAVKELLDELEMSVHELAQNVS